MPKPELLAPAGSVQTFWAGFKAGADAFYLGVQDFNARKRAKNFSVDEIRDIIAFCHRNRRRAYVTINTLVYDSEMPALIGLLESLEEFRADAVIVQDLGVLRLVSRHFPGLKIHASTQMFCHNSAGAQALKDLGVSRIILPRELSLGEIRDIREKVPLEYEIFVHGAMCFSFSGCCLASSHLFGKSGNRGECVQVCRFAFTEGEKRIFPFSMRDLDARPLLPEILALSPAALKIEGRLKNADYVEKTVTAYRKLLDGPGRPGKDGKAFMDRKDAASGYFHNADYRTLVRYDSPGTTGEAIGKVVSCRAMEITARIHRPVKKGMRLRVLAPSGKSAVEETLIDFSQRTDGRGQTLVWRLRDRFDYRGNPSELKVFLIGESRPGSPLPFIRREAALHKPVPVKMEAQWDDRGLTLTAAGPGFEGPFSQTFALTSDAARQEGSLYARLEAILKETSEHPFAVHSVAISMPHDLFIPLSELKKARRDFYGALAARLSAAAREKSALRLKVIKSEIRQIMAKYEGPASPRTLAFGKAVSDVKLSGPLPPGESVLLLPVFIPEGSLSSWEKRLEEFRQAGFRRFMAQNLSGLELLKKLPGLELYTGPFLYACNSVSFDLLREKGARGIALCPDLPDLSLLPLPRFKGAVRISGAPKDMFITRLRLPNPAYRSRDMVLRVERFEEYDRVLLPVREKAQKFS